MKTFGLACVAVFVLMSTATPVFAADIAGTGNFYGNAIGAGIGAGLTILGAALGFGRIGGSALESMARQPETADKVQTAMLIIAALLEGATFFALIVCIIMGFKS